MEYDIVERTTRLQLVAAVEAAIDRGWTPQGGIFCIEDEQGMSWAQAMIKMEQAAHQFNIREWGSATLPPSLLEKVDA